MWLFIAIAIIAALAYAAEQLAPRQVAGLLPDSWSKQAGAQIEKRFAERGDICETLAGRVALSRLASRLGSSSGSGAIPDVRIDVYRIPVLNAFTLPGRHILQLSQVIDDAETPAEVAGVLAHELGHVAHRDAEAQYVRELGLQVLAGAFAGGTGSGGLALSMASITTLLSYSRAAESEADSFALAALHKAEIDPAGLKRFFERIQDGERQSPSAALDQVLGAFVTHPGTAERIQAIVPLAPGAVTRPALDAADW